MRVIRNINSGWRFIQKNVKESEVLSVKGKKVNLPHTWNNLDGQDGGGDYFKGTCWYYKKLGKLPLGADEVAYLEFEGVHSIADVYLNGKLLAHHEGGFSTFRVRIDEQLNDTFSDERIISTPNSKIKLYIVPTNEEVMIARDTVRVAKIN